MLSQSWRCALIIGGAGGLSRLFAQSLVKRGTKVYMAGKSESDLARTVKEIGAAGYFVVDVGDISSLPAFVKKVTKEVPDIDFFLNNMAIRRLVNFEAGADLNIISQEININTTSLVHLCALFIPHLKTKPRASIQIVGSGLAYVPLTIVPIYSATKAFLKSFTLSLREQLRSTNITVVEISPPRVEFAPHCDYTNPDKEGDYPPAVPQEKWVARVEKGWDKGKEEIGAGWSQTVIDIWRKAFGEIFRKMTGKSRGRIVDLL
ncbi:unnamed protein product [Rhizoctonia solani]|uniref:Uncharacterized protein n=1 Tax=Rhizoctonia solani TaxID=456999 RepID=A0A8H3HE44_9AGAM|nr:unnamed protein product [Rhizoctonia solani]